MILHIQLRCRRDTVLGISSVHKSSLAFLARGKDTPNMFADWSSLALLLISACASESIMRDLGPVCTCHVLMTYQSPVGASSVPCVWSDRHQDGRSDWRRGYVRVKTCLGNELRSKSTMLPQCADARMRSTQRAKTGPFRGILYNSAGFQIGPASEMAQSSSTVCSRSGSSRC